MVISSSNRTPSPMSTRPNPNPNPNPNSRTHQEREGVVPARKSFSGYPLGKPSIISQPRSFIPNTPANSPAEYAKRNSFSRDHEQKENERDNPNSKPIGARPRSPSVLKGSKNFMSPTISAASKINPSPRKKVLGERNEAIRTSASLSDGKFQFFSTSSLEFSDENEPKIDTEHPTTDFDKVQAKNVAELNPEERRIESEPDLVVISPEVPLNITESSDQILPLSEMPKDVAESNVVLDVKSATCSSPPVIAPLDADPSLPPYDPKTNYLSPRPQFLCYKPNPRIESYISQGLRLEDEFSSESCSETENSEATQSENSPKEQEDSSSSTEGTSHIVEKPPSSESNPTESQETQVAVEPKIEPSSRFFTKSRAVVFALIFLLGLVSFSVTYAPGLGNATYRDEIISLVYNDPYVVVDLAKVNFNGLVQRADLAQVNFSGLVQRAKLWSAHSVDYLSQMIHSLRQVNEFNPVLFSNLTGWAEEEDYVVGDFELGSFFERKEDGDLIVEDFGLISFVGKEDGQGTTMDRSAENFAESESNPETEEQKPLVEETNLVMLGDSEPEKVEEKSVLPLDHCEDCLVDVEDLNADIRGQSSIAHAAENQEVDHVQVQEEDISSDVGFGLENDAKAEGSSSQDAGVDQTQAENQEADHVQVQENISSDVGFGLKNDAKAEGSSSQDAGVDQTQVEDISSVVEFEFQNDAKGEDTSSQDPEVQPEVSSVPLGQDDDQSSLNNETVEMMEEVKTNYEVVPETTPRSTQLPLLSERSLAPTTTTISLVVASLLASAAAVVFMKQRKANSAISVPLAGQLTLKEKSTMEKSVASVKEPSMIHECPPSWSGPVEVDMSSEPCPSEISSFQKTSSHSKRSGRRGADEAQSQSQERRPKRDYNKRESFASSSSEYTMCSSFGSFTSYSIIPSKKGDEEVVTPVRRSSRIRNQVTSP